MLFTTSIIRTPVDHYYIWYCYGNHGCAYNGIWGIAIIADDELVIIVV